MAKLPSSLTLERAFLVGVVAAAICAASAEGVLTAGAAAQRSCRTARHGGARCGPPRVVDPHLGSATSGGKAESKRLGLLSDARGLRVAVMGMASAGLSSQLRAAGITWDRIDVGNGSNISGVRYALNHGVKALVLYDPHLAGRSPKVCAAQVRALARRIRPFGLSEIEFGNEVYDKGSTPQAYAAQYAAAHAAVAGIGVTLIADSFGDYRRPDGTWSQDAAGGGWIHDFIRAVRADGAQIDAFSIHPYGPMNKLTNGEDNGWLMVPRYHQLALANGVNVPWYITEVGQNLGKSNTSHPVSATTQAADVTKYLNDTIFKYAYVKYLDFYAIKDNATGRWGLLNSTGSPRPSFSTLVRWMSAHPSVDQAQGQRVRSAPGRSAMSTTQAGSTPH